MQLVHVASATALALTQVWLMNWPGGQTSLQAWHTASDVGVHAAAVYCQYWQVEHGTQL